MKLLRRLTAPLAVSLAMVLAGEVTDVLPCADTDCGVWSLVLGQPGPGDGGASNGAPSSACLCHAAFAMDAAAPRLHAPDGEAQPVLTLSGIDASAGPSDVPHPPPLG